jgi:hypothetical protein
VEGDLVGGAPSHESDNFSITSKASRKKVVTSFEKVCILYKKMHNVDISGSLSINCSR